MVKDSFARRLMRSLATLAIGISLIAGCAQSAPQNNAQPEPAAENTTAIAEQPVDPIATRDILPSWDQKSEAYQRLTSFVESVVDPTSDQYLPPEERIVTTDMDGTFLCEKAPTYFDQCFSLWHALHDPAYEAPADLKARSEAMIDEFYTGDITPEHGPELNYTLAEAYTGHEPEELASDVLRFAESVDVVGFSGMKYGESFYKPMLEVIDYLRANDFDVWVVSASERLVARPICVSYAGFAPDHVIGSDFIVRAANQDTADGLDYTLEQDEELLIGGGMVSETGSTNKPIAILNEIGCRPIIAFGNSSGDYAMLNYTVTNPDHEGIGFLVLCDDTAREYGDLVRAAKQEKEAEDSKWVTISMANDWSTIYGEGVERTQLASTHEEAVKLDAAA